MSQFVVLDASALLAVALHEPGRDIVLSYIKQTDTTILIHSVNVFEVVTKLSYRGIPPDDAWAVVDLYGITRIDEAGDDILRNAVKVKMSAPALSLGDCVCIALAESSCAVCLTSDRVFMNAKTSAKISLIR